MTCRNLDSQMKESKKKKKRGKEGRGVRGKVARKARSLFLRMNNSIWRKGLTDNRTNLPKDQSKKCMEGGGKERTRRRSLSKKGGRYRRNLRGKIPSGWFGKRPFRDGVPVRTSQKGREKEN